MKIKKFLAVVLTVAMVAAMSVTAFAADLPSMGTQKNETPNSETTIPVTISADATTLNVTVPTTFPAAVGPDGTPTTSEDAKITNNSYGAIKVTSIKAKNANNWNLAAYDTDMSKEKVDANKIGLSVAAKGGKTAATGGTALKTTDSGDDQELLTGHEDEWVIDGQNAGDTDELTVDYEANVSAVSVKVDNKVVANIVITIAWDAVAGD